MKTLYLDCSMGAAGDMLTAALYELLPEKERAALLEKLNKLGIPGVVYTAEPAVKCGITGTHMRVTVNGEEECACGCGGHEHAHDHGHEHTHDHDHDHEGHEGHAHAHHHSGMHEIEHIVRDHLKLPTMVTLDVLAVYQEIAEAESQVHGMLVDQIHFHEVGSMDAVADIAAVCLLMSKIDPDEVVVSPIHVGAGQVKCAHGVLPVPAPATAHILKGIPTYGGSIQGELCTPTGAALLKHFATKFGAMPIMRTSAIGYGMGKKDFPQANCVRAMLGESERAAGSGAAGDTAYVCQAAKVVPSSAQAFADDAKGISESIIELSCNVDDMTGEEIGFAIERLLEAGANEALYVPCGMKKSRPGIILTVLCKEEKREEMVQVLFKNTTTIGIRETTMKRYILDRTTENVETPSGTIRKKISSGFGVKREKYEYDDLAKMAREQGISLAEAREQVRKNEQ